MKKLYTYKDFINNNVNESFDEIHNNIEDLLLNEIQSNWSSEETKSMYDLTKDNVYEKLKGKFFNRIDIILTKDENLFDPTKIAPFGNYYDWKMNHTLDKKNKYKDLSKIIKDTWGKIFEKLSFTEELQLAYDTFQKDGKFISYVKSKYKSSYEFLDNFVYKKDRVDFTSDNDKLNQKINNGYLNSYENKMFYQEKTNAILKTSILKDENYTNTIKMLKTIKNDGVQVYPNIDADLENEFKLYYTHYHLWVFANIIMTGKSVTPSKTNVISKSGKPSSTQTTSTKPQRDRILVDRNRVGEELFGL